ncbi:hypothetical protein KIL84_009940 [Mauremys mutica]|uniref:Uncharacterized protein n=1 Tax=Mauremys mutica TaxID=74926 RepID=A0A9D3XLS9_9SAUR|nr:hypothetical protein KIL84_009940 [Mauremys mutica]
MMLSILQADPNSAGEFTCAYEETMNGRWSLAVNVTVTAHSYYWVRDLAVGGSFFTINGLIFLIFHLCRVSLITAVSLISPNLFSVIADDTFPPMVR